MPRPMIQAALVLFLAIPPATGPSSRPAGARPGPASRPAAQKDVDRLMSRKPPAAGAPAPDFTLPSIDGRRSITRSRQAAGRPQVLVFGSFT